MTVPAIAPNFAVWVPLIKARPSDELANGYAIHGVASTEEPDEEEETAVQEGMDFAPFLKSGHLNWNHLPGPENVIGEPTSVQKMTLGEVPDYPLRRGQNPTTPCSFISGVLYKGHKRAEATWELMGAMAKAADAGQSQRGLGYSVEGAVLARAITNSKRLAKTMVRHCAVTHEPINTGSWARMAKSFGAEQGETGDLIAYPTFKSFAKALTLATAQPLLLEALNGGVSRDEIRRLALGLVPCKNGCHDGTSYKLGKAGMLQHLVNCAEWRPDDAAEHITALVKALN